MNSRDIAPWVPFGLYDFYGYLFPGIFIFISSIIFFKYSFIDQLICNTIWSTCRENGVLMVVLLGSFAIVLLYILGHVVSTLSSIIYGIINDGITGYPYITLLKIPTVIREYSRASHGYSLFILNMFILLPLFITDQNKIKIVAIWATIIIIILFIFRFIIAIFETNEQSKIILKKIANNKLVRFSLLPYKIIEIYITMLKKLISVDRTFSDNFIKRYKIKFKNDFSLISDEVGSDNFWLPYHKVNNSAPENVALIRNWLHLYGFSRNISTAAYIVCFFMVIILTFGNKVNYDAFRIQLFSTYIVAWLLGLGYWRIFHTYYTKFIIRTYVCMDSKEDSIVC